MYICNSCKKSFEWVKVITEKHGMGEPPYERILLCPHCNGSDFYEKKTGYCRCCGRKIPDGREYCSETCRKAGELMWERERENKLNRSKNPVYGLLLELEAYNKAHGTRLSYGQYTALKQAKRSEG